MSWASFTTAEGGPYSSSSRRCNSPKSTSRRACPVAPATFPPPAASATKAGVKVCKLRARCDTGHGTEGGDGGSGTFQIGRGVERRTKRRLFESTEEKRD